jgi:hypothetical protein
MLPKADLKTKENFDEDYNVTFLAKHKAPTTSKKNVAVKRQKKKCVLVPQYPRRNSTRVTNKYRLRPKSMFDSSIKREDVIVIEDHSEDAKADIKQNIGNSPVHKEPAKEGKKTIPFSTRPVTRDTTKLSRAKAFAKGISRVPETKESNIVDSEHISDMPEAMDLASSYEEHNSGLVSKYQIKMKEPQVSIDLNELALAEEFLEFRVKVITDKEKIRELHKTVEQFKKDKSHLEKWSAKQQEKLNTTERRKNKNQIREILCFSCFSPYIKKTFLKLWRCIC